LNFAIAPSVGLIFAPGLSDLLNRLPVSTVVGVGNNPDAIPLMGRPDVGGSHNTPSRVIPQFGKVTEDHGKSSSNKER